MRALCTLPSIGPMIAHPLATRFQSLGALGAWVLGSVPPSDAGGSALGGVGTGSGTAGKKGKVREVEEMGRVGAAKAMRVGPKAAAQLVEVLMSEDPDLLIHDS
jgi:hypothetical protein